MNSTYELYIGAGMNSSKIDIEKIRELLIKRHDTFTVKGIAEGYWGGVENETAIIMLTDIPDYVMETVEYLKEELDNPQISIVEISDWMLL